MSLIHTADSDGINQTPISASNPMPVAGGIAHDAAVGSTVAPTIIGGVGTNGVQTAVSANGDAVRAAFNLTGNIGVCAPSGGSDAGGDGISTIGSFALRTGASASANPVFVANAVKNGSTWDCQRGDTNATAVQPALCSTFWGYAAASGGISNSTTAVTIKAAAGASVRNYLQALQIDWDALTNATEIAIRDGAGGAVLWRGKIAAGAAGQRQIVFNPPLKGTAATLMEVVTLTASGAGAVFVNAQGWTGA